MKPKRPPKRTVDEIEKALRAANGLKSVAAEALGVTWLTVHNQIKKSKRLQQVLLDCREDVIDIAESALISKLKDKEWPAIKYALTMLGQKRGYIYLQKIAPTDPTGDHPYNPNVDQVLMDELGDEFKRLLAEQPDTSKVTSKNGANKKKKV